MKFDKRAFLLIGLVFFAFILSRVDLSLVIETLAGIDAPVYVSALFILLMLILLKGLKWKAILESQGRKISLAESTRLVNVGFFVSSVTPGRIGDFVRALYLKEDGVPLSIGVSSVVLDRVIDVSILLCFALLSSLAFISLYGYSAVSVELILLVFIVFAAGVFLLFKEKYLKMLLRPAFNLIVPDSMKERVSIGFSSFFSALKLVEKKPLLFLSSVLLGLVIWVVGTFFFYLLAVSLSIGMPLEFTFLVFPVISLLDLIPISVSGIGTRDVSLVFLLSFVSVASEGAVALSLLFFFTGYVLVAFFGLLFFLRRPVKVRFWGAK